MRSLLTASMALVGFMIGMLTGGVAPTVVRMELARYVETSLSEKYPTISDEDIDSVRHSATWAYASIAGVVQTYYRIDWKYDERAQLRGTID